MLRRCLLVTGLLVSLLATSPTRSEGPEPRPERPRLAVLVVFDQMRGDYLSRWGSLFGKDGFRRLEAEGTWFQNCHYPYAVTVTGAGHASVATGCSPSEHGIIDNEWYDRAAARSVNCVSSDRYERVPPRPSTSTTANKLTADNKAQGVSPDRLRVQTLADTLRKATNGKGRVVSLSFKDRSAVLPGGHQPNACYWLDSNTGEFVTSTYYRERLHPWVEEFNRSNLADQWLGQSWTLLRPELDYERYSGPDDVPGEGIGSAQGRVFPHPFPPKLGKLTSVYFGAVFMSPMGNDLLLDLAEKAIVAEKLGSHEAPDLLCVSFSSNDAVGHVWGPDSEEVLDTTLRSDDTMKRLLACLDRQVGKGKYVIAVTADHGICPLPEVARRQGKSAGRVPPSLLDTEASDFLSEHYQVPSGEVVNWVEATADPWIYLNQSVLRTRGLKRSEVEEVLAGWLRKQDGVEAVYTRTQLVAELPERDTVGRMVQRSFDAERAGDLIVIVKPYHIITARLTGTTHGTPHPYDTHVPLLVAGPGIAHAVRSDAITPQAAAVILAHALGVPPPPNARAPLPARLFVPASQ